MNTNTVIPEQIEPTTLFNGAVTGTGDAKGVKPVGSQSVTVLCLVTMANAADLTLSIVTADDADGTTPVAIAETVPVYVDNVRESSDAKSYAVTAATGSFLVSFNVPSLLIPADKYLCLSFANSNDANILSAVALTDTYYNG